MVNRIWPTAVAGKADNVSSMVTRKFREIRFQEQKVPGQNSRNGKFQEWKIPEL